MMWSRDMVVGEEGREVWVGDVRRWLVNETIKPSV